MMTTTKESAPAVTGALQVRVAQSPYQSDGQAARSSLEEIPVAVNFDDIAETAGLGGLMTCPNFIPQAREKASPSDFWRKSHQRIFQTILDMSDEGVEIDSITVAGRLRDDPDVNAMGGRAYVHSLSRLGYATWTPEFFETIHRLAVERRRSGKLPALLDDLARFVGRFVFLTLPEHLTAVALWIAHTWIVEQFETTPYLGLVSPEKRSGKSQLLDVLALLVARPWPAVTPSEAVLYRKIEADRPTLLLDEIDGIFGPRAAPAEATRAILNAGFRRGRKVPRCGAENKSITLQEFDVYCAKAFAGIGRLPDTISDRCIIIDMVRKAGDESVASFRYRYASAEAAPLRAVLERWSQSVDLSEAWPEIPKGLDDRAADTWEPLLTIAEAAGPEWTEKAQRAARVLSAGRMEETASWGVRLLFDCQHIFDAVESDRLGSGQLVDALKEIEEAPWADMTARKLAAKLKPYHIAPHGLRVGEKTPKGYMRTAFEDAWRRYLPSLPSDDSNPQHRNILEERPANDEVLPGFQSATFDPLTPRESPNVADTNCGDLQGNLPFVADVADKRLAGEENTLPPTVKVKV